MTGGTWRDLLKVHPAADAFPMMSEDELGVLTKDIGRDGGIHINVPPVFWTPIPIEDFPRSKKRYDAEVYLLDGRNRVEALWRSLDPALPENEDEDRKQHIRLLVAAAIDGRHDQSILLYGDADPWAFVVSANLHRRHLSRDEKRDIIGTLLKANPNRSDRETAKIAKVDHKTVAAVREAAERRGEIPHVSTRTDSEGRQQPSSKTRIDQRQDRAAVRAVTQTAPTERPREPAPWSENEALIYLNSISSQMWSRRQSLSSLSFKDRADAARGLLVALDIRVEDMIEAEEIAPFKDWAD